MEQQKIDEIRSIAQDAGSLDFVNDTHQTPLSELIEDESESPPFQNAFHVALHNIIDDVLGQLSRREMRIIELRFGLHGEGPFTLQETGKLLGITRERVRQIQEKALVKLRKLGEHEGMQAFL